MGGTHTCTKMGVCEKQEVGGSPDHSILRFCKGVVVLRKAIPWEGVLLKFKKFHGRVVRKIMMSIQSNSFCLVGIEILMYYNFYDLF